VHRSSSVTYPLALAFYSNFFSNDTQTNEQKLTLLHVLGRPAL